MRAKRKKRKRNANWLKRIAIFLVIVGAVIALMHIDYFNVNNIKVYGTDLLTEKQVLSGTGIKEGKNIFDTIPFIEKRKIKGNLYVDHVDIDRKLPDEIRVTVKEKRGLAQIQKNAGYIVIDNDSLVIEKSKDIRKVTVLEGIKASKAARGNYIEVDKSGKLKKMLKIIAKADQCDMFFKSISIENGRVKGCIYGELVVEGAYENIIASLEEKTLNAVVYNLYQKDVSKGTIHVSGDNYCSYKK